MTTQPSTPMPSIPISPAEIYTGRNVFLLGSTGFLGKVTLAMLLSHFPSIGRVYAMVRAGSGTDSETRFWNDVVTSPVFDALRQRYGAALEGFLRDKVRVVGGDIVLENLGYSEEEAQRIAQDIDVIINSSGKVTFNPALDQSLRTNVNGTLNLIQFTKRMRRPCLVHVSTCFVAGNRSGQIWESEKLDGFFPRLKELEGAKFDVHQEIADCARLAERVRQEADDAVQTAYFLAAARERLRDEGRDPDNDRAVRLAQARERKNWIRDRLTTLGIERAQRWGWPNIYCYTKAMGDQLVAAETGIVRSIVRPSIVESALSFPFPGWNEGFTTTAPLIFLALKGQNLFPASEKLILDIIPVDYVAGGLLAVAAQACVEQPPLVHQLCSGDDNPIHMPRVVTLLGLHKRRHFQQKQTGTNWANELIARMEAQPVAPTLFNQRSLPMFRRIADHTDRMLDKIRPRWGGGQFVDVVDQVQARVGRLKQVTSSMHEAFEMYRPFTVENHYTFRADNMRALQQRIPVEERPLVPWGIKSIDWYTYWMDVHFPGLHKWVLPELERDFAATPPKAVYTYNHLIELFETQAKLHRTRIAMRITREGRTDQYTYEDLQELAHRAAGYLVEAGTKPGDRIMLLAPNCPEWAMAYFGILRAGATCVPIDRDTGVDEILALAKAGKVRGFMVHDSWVNKHFSDNYSLFASRFTQEIPSSSVWRFSEVFDLSAYDAKPIPVLPERVSSDATASIVFTSGTVGQPKGVMLTHRNFTHMVSQLSPIFDFGVRDGVLSVLPLHHVFEFSAGLLTPLATGAQITYLEELNSENLLNALKRARVTAIVGVPALWELLQRKLWHRLADKSPQLEHAIENIVKWHSWLRNKTPFNLGTLLFFPVHQLFGGRIRFLISGGSALNTDVARRFHGLGFRMLEGYGLTEAAPVLTVARPNNDWVEGSVGKALAHVDVQIQDPDERGVGEVIARGHNIMAGYFEHPKATDETIRDGWLHTGDLGYFDEENNLFLVGRSKEVIVDSNGKNVYPDELEELYGASPYIKELSVVGLPDGTSERIAALIVADYAHDVTLSRADVDQHIRTHMQQVSTTLPFYKRIKVWQLWDGTLPRTATKKVKRREVIKELQRLTAKETAAAQATLGTASASPHDWLFDIVSALSGKPRKQIGLSTRFDHIGFDSLMYTELAAAVEARGGGVHSTDDLTGLATVGDLAQLVRHTSTVKPIVVASSGQTRDYGESDDLYVPDIVGRVGRAVLGRGQKILFDHYLGAEYHGQTNVPVDTNFIVAPNHCSHLDTGLVKVALGPAGDHLCALAASDYFFDDRYKRAYFENFTNVVPMDRSGSLRKSLRRADDLLAQGYNLLIFAEGTRSVTGEMGEFKASLGYLALHNKIGILPMHLSGTIDALPKGHGLFVLPKPVRARIGPFLRAEQLVQLTDKMPRSVAYRYVSWLTQRIVEHLRDGIAVPADLNGFRAQWQKLAEQTTSAEGVEAAEATL